MKKAYYVNGNYNGNSCEDAVVVAANNREAAVTEALREGVEAFLVEEVKANFEVVETSPGHFERGLTFNCAFYPESFFE